MAAMLKTYAFAYTLVRTSGTKGITNNNILLVINESSADL